MNWKAETLVDGQGMKRKGKEVKGHTPPDASRRQGNEKEHTVTHTRDASNEKEKSGNQRRQGKANEKERKGFEERKQCMNWKVVFIGARPERMELSGQSELEGR